MTALSRRTLILGGVALAVAPSRVMAQVQADGLASRPPLRPVPDARDLIVRAGLPGRVAAAVRDLERGVVLEGVEAGAPMPPASILKIATAAYALDRLGPEHRFRTRLVDIGDMLVLAGGGDPVLSTDHLALLADALVASGRPAPPRFGVWGGALPRLERIAPGQAEHVAYNPAISGMILNFNRVHLGWRRADDGYQMSLEARAATHSPRAYTVTARAEDQAPLFTYRDLDGRESWTVSRAAMGRAGSRWLPVRQPELYAGDVFQTLCRARGLVLPNPEVIAQAPMGDVVAQHHSAALRDILRDMLYYSTNLTAEVVGLHASGARDIAGSARAMGDWMARAGHGEGVRPVDHSGLGADSRITPRAMLDLLAGPARDLGLEAMLKPDPLRESLGKAFAPQPGIRAKTGTLNFVSNLAGYAHRPDGRELAFVIMCADGARHAATRGQERPAGVVNWTRDAKRLQQQLVEAWMASPG